MTETSMIKGYDLSDFKNQKAFIHFDGFIDDKWDYGARICINTQGEKLFELPDRDMIINEFEDEDVGFVINKNGKYAVINAKGEFLTDFIYDHIYGGSEEGLFEAERNGKHGHVDINGKEVIPCIYDDGCYFSEGLAAESLNGKWGMVDYHNNTVIPFEYEEICICKNNLINAKKQGKYGLINKNNDVVVDFLYDEIDCWSTRKCLVYPARKGDYWGIIDRKNNIIEDFIYNDAQLIADNEDNAGEFIILLRNNKKAVYSTKKCDFITDFKYDFIDYYSEGRIAVCTNHKCGFIDINGDEIIPLIYDDIRIHDFNEGLCVVYKNDKAGVINLDGELVIPCIYKHISDCNEGLLCATDADGNQGYINRKNETVIPFGKFSCTRRSFHDGFAIVVDDKLGNVYINKAGEILKIKTIYKYSLKDLEKMEACELYLLTNVVKFNEIYYLPDEKIPYPSYDSHESGKFESLVVCEEEYTCDEQDYDEVYRGIEPLYTNVTTNFILPDKTVETGIVAQIFIDDYPKFIEKLEKNNHAVYHNEEFTPFKWLTWVNDNSIRLIHQDYKETEVKTEFDIVVDKDWFLQFSQNLINSMKHYSEAELNKYNNYVKAKYKKNCR